MMRREWVSIIGAGLCISLVPACSPLFRRTSNDVPSPATVKRQEPVDLSPASVTPGASHPLSSADPAVQPVVRNETLIEPARHPAKAIGSELIPEPRSLAEASAAFAPPPEQSIQAGHDPYLNAKPAEEPPLLQALRCFLDNRPAEAVAWLGRYDKPNQELLLYLLPLAVRLTEGDWQRCDSREANAVVDRLDRLVDQMATTLRPRADLIIKNMCFCSRIDGYGKYRPIPDSHSFQPGDLARIYVEFRNLSDQRQGNEYGIHLRTTIVIRDFSGQRIWRLNPNPGPDLSHSGRHDFYNVYRCVVPLDLLPGYYTLDLEVTDVPTGRKVNHTLDFQVIPGSGKRDW